VHKGRYLLRSATACVFREDSPVTLDTCRSDALRNTLVQGRIDQARILCGKRTINESQSRFLASKSNIF
jgi:hypothetical protein